MIIMSGDSVRNAIKAKRETQEEFNESFVNINPKNQFLLHDDNNEV